MSNERIINLGPPPTLNASPRLPNATPIDNRPILNHASPHWAAASPQNLRLAKTSRLCGRVKGHRAHLATPFYPISKTSSRRGHRLPASWRGRVGGQGNNVDRGRAYRGAVGSLSKLGYRQWVKMTDVDCGDGERVVLDKFVAD